jgi:hypothetical protein
MGEKLKLNKANLLNKLGEIKYDLDKEQDENLISGLSVAKSLPRLAGINNENEYLLIKKVAEKLLDTVPSTEDND